MWGGQCSGFVGSEKKGRESWEWTEHPDDLMDKTVSILTVQVIELMADRQLWSLQMPGFSYYSICTCLEDVHILPQIGIYRKKIFSTHHTCNVWWLFPNTSVYQSYINQCFVCSLSFFSHAAKIKKNKLSFTCIYRFTCVFAMCGLFSNTKL